RALLGLLLAGLGLRTLARLSCPRLHLAALGRLRLGSLPLLLLAALALRSRLFGLALARDQLDVRHRGRVPVSVSDLDDARVATRTTEIARRHLVEQLVEHLAVPHGPAGHAHRVDDLGPLVILELVGLALDQLGDRGAPRDRAL